MRVLVDSWQLLMNLIEKATITHYHRYRIAEYSGGTVKALGWKGEESQVKRFEALTAVGDLNGCTLLDVGCGYGDLKGYLDRSFSGFTYIGIDQMPEFIAEALNKYEDCADTFFYQTDFVTMAFPRVDYVIASGALGYRCDNPEFYADMIRKLYGAATRAVAFNMLDAAHFPQHELLVGYDCEQVVAFCDALSPCVKVVRGYLEDDFTVFVYRLK
jgi:trans-aconitate methyltransferase